MARKRPSAAPLDPDASIEAIVQRNIQSGRFQRVCRFHHTELTLEQYTLIIQAYYIKHHPQVSLLMKGDEMTWQEFRKHLCQAARTRLSSYNLPHEQIAARAEETAQEICAIIHQQPYPFDCPFDAWVLNILRHHIFRRYHHPRDPFDTHHITDLSEETVDNLAVTDTSDPGAMERYEPLLQALSQLKSPEQQSVLKYLFFENLSVEETAQKMGKTPQAIYNLKGRALSKLRSLLKSDDWRPKPQEKPDDRSLHS